LLMPIAELLCCMTRSPLRLQCSSQPSPSQLIRNSQQATNFQTSMPDNKAMKFQIWYSLLMARSLYKQITATWKYQTKRERQRKIPTLPFFTFPKIPFPFQMNDLYALASFTRFLIITLAA
jgi:hypothetical protein